jgi:hypothetical protein
MAMCLMGLHLTGLHLTDLHLMGVYLTGVSLMGVKKEVGGLLYPHSSSIIPYPRETEQLVPRSMPRVAMSDPNALS